MRIKELELQNLMSRQKEESTSEERKPTLRTRDLDSGAMKQKRGLFDWFRPRRDNVQERPIHDGIDEIEPSPFLQGQECIATPDPNHSSPIINREAPTYMYSTQKWSLENDEDRVLY